MPATDNQTFRAPMNDPAWTAVDDYAKTYLHDHNTPLGKALTNALRLSDEYDLDTYIAVSPLQGKQLALQCRLSNVRNALEIGTLGGYSSIWLTSANDDIHVTTIDADPAAYKCAQQAHKEAGLDSRIECLLGPGMDVLPAVRADVDSGRREKFGFVFIDADKENNLNYVKAALPMCTPNACIIVDNIARRGRLAMNAQELENARIHDDQKARILGAREVVEAAESNERVAGATMIQTVGEKGYDGYLMIVVK